jgi:ribosome-binding protein aMBF1 (putative translation factor)
MAECVVCAKVTSGSLEFCQVCYHRWKDEIKNKKPWTKVLKNDAQRERRRKKREYEDSSLDELMESYSTRKGSW